jgi:hypothetical protein
MEEFAHLRRARRVTGEPLYPERLQHKPEHILMLV